MSKTHRRSVFPAMRVILSHIGFVLHPTRSVHIRCVDSGWRSRGKVRASERSERAFEPGGMLSDERKALDYSFNVNLNKTVL